MRPISQSLVLLTVLGSQSVALAGPETTGLGVDLEMLDMNGAPFRAFHLGRYSQGLDAERPTAATAMPSDALAEDHGPTQAPERYTGVDSAPVNALPQKPDIAPLLGGYDEALLRPGTNN